jgi:hypothetical protein
LIGSSSTMRILPLDFMLSFLLFFISVVKAPGWEFTDRLFVIDFMKKMVYPTNNNKSKLVG